MIPPFDHLRKNPSKTKAWLKHTDGVQFQLFLQEWLNNAEKSLRTSGDINEVTRCQGRVEILERLVNLPEELERYQRDVSAGRLPVPDKEKK